MIIQLILDDYIKASYTKTTYGSVSTTLTWVDDKSVDAMRMKIVPAARYIHHPRSIYLTTLMLTAPWCVDVDDRGVRNNAIVALTSCTIEQIMLHACTNEMSVNNLKIFLREITF